MARSVCFTLSLASLVTSSLSSCSSNHVEASLSLLSPCQPRPVVVELPWPNNTEVHQMTPTHVEVFRCGGACLSSPGLTRCEASLTRTKTVPVMLARCGVKAGLCDKQCATISVEEHSSCHCDCSQESRKNCEESELHLWREEGCQCQCKDSQVGQGGNTAQCQQLSNLIIVQGRRHCEERGDHWLSTNCTCQLKIGFTLHTQDTQDSRDTSQHSEYTVSITREIIVIVLLSTINICLIVILLMLVARLRAVLRSGRTKERYEVNRAEDSYLKGPRVVSEKAYSDCDIYSASSGFVSQCSHNQETEEPCYQTVQSGRQQTEETARSFSQETETPYYQTVQRGRQQKEEPCYQTVHSYSEETENPLYQTAQSVRENKYQLKETYQEMSTTEPDMTYGRAMLAIDETLQMLKESADKL